MAKGKIDPFTLEVIRNRMRSVSKEMVITLIKTAYSPVIFDGKDCSCAVLDARGQLLTLDAGLPLHIAPMPFSVKEVIRDFQKDIRPGDIFMVNSPYRGGTHLPDVLVVCPVFYKRKLVFFCAARGHWTDVGGAVPGSLSGKANEIHQEGIVLAPMKLYEGGRLNAGAFNMILHNVRIPEERAGDIRAQVAACKTAERRLIELLDKYGLERVSRTCSEIITASENYVRSVFRNLPDGRASFEDYLDGDGVGEASLRIKATVSIEDDSLSVDFSGTDPQSAGPYNTSLAVSHGAVVVATKIVFDPYGTMNEGIFRAIRVNVPEGTLLNARYPAATGGFGEVAYRAIFTVIGALGKMMPEHVSGSDYGAINHCYVTARDDGRHSIYYVYPPGGNGGTAGMDGPGGLRGPSSGDVAMQSLESVESRHPVLFRALRFRKDSGGAGKFRGGPGLSLQLQVLSKMGGLNIVSDRTYIPPFGMFSAHSASPNEWKVLRGGQEQIISGGKAVNHPLQKQDVVVMNTGGGGGYGDPLERDPERVRHDVLEGLVSVESASDSYGVLFREKSFEVDEGGTAAQRTILRGRRRFFLPRKKGESVFSRGIRVLRVHPGKAGTEFPEESLVELVSRRQAAPVRFRVRLDREVDPGEVMLDAEVWEILDCRDGELVEIRSVANGVA